jgi:ribonuclease HI
LDRLTIYIDGAARGNPGPAAIAGIIFDPNGKELERFSIFLGQKTNNQAEYLALIEALKRATKYKPEKVEVRSDSELIVKQLNGEYAVKDQKLKELFDQAKELISNFKDFRIVNILREENKEADRLCNLALDAAVQKKERVGGIFTVTAVGKFDCAHFLPEYEGKCGTLHGHTYRVEVTVFGSVLKEGMLIDIVELKRILESSLEEFDHKYLNELEYFKEKSPTAENIALILHELIAPKLPSGIGIYSIKVYESETSFITYFPRGLK